METNNLTPPIAVEKDRNTLTFDGNVLRMCPYEVTWHGSRLH